MQETEVAAEEPAVKKEEKAEEPKAKRTRASKKEDTKPAAKTAASKETKTAEPKTKTRTTAKAAASEKVVLQVGGREDLIMNSLIDRVKAAYVAEGHKADTIKNIEVYIKVDESMAYYVIDGYASGISLY